MSQESMSLFLPPCTRSASYLQFHCLALPISIPTKLDDSNFSASQPRCTIPFSTMMDENVKAATHGTGTNSYRHYLPDPLPVPETISTARITAGPAMSSVPGSSSNIDPRNMKDRLYLQNAIRKMVSYLKSNG